MNVHKEKSAISTMRAGCKGNTDCIGFEEDKKDHYIQVYKLTTELMFDTITLGSLPRVFIFC